MHAMRKFAYRETTIVMWLWLVVRQHWPTVPIRNSDVMSQADNHGAA